MQLTDLLLQVLDQQLVFGVLFLHSFLRNEDVLVLNLLELVHKAFVAFLEKFLVICENLNRLLHLLAAFFLVAQLLLQLLDFENELPLLGLGLVALGARVLEAALTDLQLLSEVCD